VRLETWPDLKEGNQDARGNKAIRGMGSFSGEEIEKTGGKKRRLCGRRDTGKI